MLRQFDHPQYRLTHAGLLAGSEHIIVELMEHHPLEPVDVESLGVCECVDGAEVEGVVVAVERLHSRSSTASPEAGAARLTQRSPSSYSSTDRCDSRHRPAIDVCTPGILDCFEWRWV